ncbi:MAG: pyridoxine 5'-phosphate synthase [Verrucomicrobiota bacterium]
MPSLGVNVDHVATLRQARYREPTPGTQPEPSVLEAARLAERAGAAGITVHLREDRRHIQEHDVADLRRSVRTRLNLEMAVTPEMVRQALLHGPEEVCLVPENRREITTEGGLDVAAKQKAVTRAATKLQANGIEVSCFIDPDPDQVRASADSGAAMVELHTGAYANTTTKRDRQRELRRHVRAARLAARLGLRVNAGHGLNLENTSLYLETVPRVNVLNIGHHLVARAVAVGLPKAVREMVKLIRETKVPPA